MDELRTRIGPLGRRYAALAAVAILALMAGVADAATTSTLMMNGGLESGTLSAWTSVGGAAQCANYGTPSKAPRLRGSFYLQKSVVGSGSYSGRVDLPAAQAPTYTMEACELTQPRPLGLGTDSYYGYMFYVPPGWSTGTNSFWGIATAQFHFQNVWGAPISFELHADHMTLALQTGSCNSIKTARPGCDWWSNADSPGIAPGKLGPYYVVPPGMRQGVWHEVVMHVHWASDSTGRIDAWHRLKGAATWTQTVNFSGHPTVQWDRAVGCCYTNAADKVGAYSQSATRPASVWFDNYMVGSTFQGVASAMP